MLKEKKKGKKKKQGDKKKENLMGCIGNVVQFSLYTN